MKHSLTVLFLRSFLLLTFQALVSCSYLPDFLAAGDRPGDGLGNKQGNKAAVDAGSAEESSLRMRNASIPAETTSPEPDKDLINKALPQGKQDKQLDAAPLISGIPNPFNVLWQMPQFSSLNRWNGPTPPTIGLFKALSVNGRSSVVSVHESGDVLLWQVAGESSTPFKLASLGFSPEVAAYLPDYNVVAASAGDIVRLFSLAETRRIAEREIGSRVTALEFQPMGRSLLVGAANGKIYRWLFAQRPKVKAASQDIEAYLGHASVIGSLKFHTDARPFFSGDWFGKLSAWLPHELDIQSGSYDENLFVGRPFSEKSPRSTADTGDQPITQIVIDDFGQNLFVALQDGRIQWWLVRGLRKMAEAQVHKGLIYELAVDSGSKKVLSVGRDARLRVSSYEEPPGKIAPPSLHLVSETEVAGARRLLISAPGVVLIATDGALVSRTY